MPNLFRPELVDTAEYRQARLAEAAGAEELGMSLYELSPGQAMVFHYHVQREELLVALRGTVSLRTATGWAELPEGEVVAFPRGERGAHGFENRTTEPVQVLMISEMNGPNISVYPDANQVGVFDAGRRSDRRFGALFNVADAVSDYGGRAELVEATRRIVEEGVDARDVDENAIASRLYAPEMPEPDLVIRTSGERRVSNFLLWQLAYAELVFVETLWPDFGEGELRSALEDYASRRRRFGGR